MMIHDPRINKFVQFYSQVQYLEILNLDTSGVHVKNLEGYI